VNNSRVGIKIDYKVSSLIEGAHVRQLNNQPDYDRSNNIIGLCPNHHIEFDHGNLKIDPEKNQFAYQ